MFNMIDPNPTGIAPNPRKEAYVSVYYRSTDVTTRATLNIVPLAHGPRKLDPIETENKSDTNFYSFSK